MPLFMAGLALSAIGGLAKNSSQKKAIRRQKQQMAAQLSDSRKGTALQQSQMKQQAAGAREALAIQKDAAQGLQNVSAAESGVGGNVAAENQHALSTQAQQAHAGIILNLQNQLAQSRRDITAQTQSVQQQVSQMRPDSLLADLISGVAVNLPLYGK
ncbi:hypothetical protein [Shewanella algae]|uniref:virion core protein, T7 gp14 family n=1 Tax=Shewanella algae TaxID=38313 RepID=UPI0008F94193|nr:hypothetical protein BFS86_09075 [Shewanella algae]